MHNHQRPASTASTAQTLHAHDTISPPNLTPTLPEFDIRSVFGTSPDMNGRPRRHTASAPPPRRQHSSRYISPTAIVLTPQVTMHPSPMAHSLNISSPTAIFLHALPRWCHSPMAFPLSFVSGGIHPQYSSQRDAFIRLRRPSLKISRRRPRRHSVHFNDGSTLLTPHIQL